jgi:hypothetical protein
MKGMRRHRKVMEMLGEQFFRIHTLDFIDLIIKDESGNAVEYILGKRYRRSLQQSQSSQMMIQSQSIPRPLSQVSLSEICLNR